MRNLFCIAVLLLGTCVAQVQAAETPSTVIHVITLKWVDGATDAQKQEVFTALKKAADSFPGIKRLWFNSFKVQGQPIGKCEDCKPLNQVIVMEFADKAALEKWAGSEAQKAFYKTYLPLREESRTHDVTN